jgi:hypothetical protein
MNNHELSGRKVTAGTTAAQVHEPCARPPNLPVMNLPVMPLVAILLREDGPGALTCSFAAAFVEAGGSLPLGPVCG